MQSREIVLENPYLKATFSGTDGLLNVSYSITSLPDNVGNSYLEGTDGILNVIYCITSLRDNVGEPLP